MCFTGDRKIYLSIWDNQAKSYAFVLLKLTIRHKLRPSFFLLFLYQLYYVLEQEKDVEDVKRSLIDGYENSFWTCSVSKLGYSGTAIISRVYSFSLLEGGYLMSLENEVFNV